MKEKSVLFWKKIPLKRILLFLFLLYLAALIVPYIPHKKVSDSFRKSFSENTFTQIPLEQSVPHILTTTRKPWPTGCV